MATVDIYHKNLSEMAPFLGTMEGYIGPWGGRRFHVRGDLDSKTLALKDIIKIVEEKCWREGKVHAPLSVIAAIKKLDGQANLALKQAFFLKRILTYIRQFFGNLRCYKYRTLERLNGHALQREDHQLSFDDFNRHPALQEAALKLMNQLIELAQTAQKAHWSPAELMELALKLYQGAPQKLQAILALPDNEHTIPLKMDLNQLIQDGQRLAAERQRNLPRVQPIAVVARQIQSPVVTLPPQTTIAPLPLRQPLEEVEPTPISAPPQKAISTETLQEIINVSQKTIENAITETTSWTDDSPQAILIESQMKILFDTFWKCHYSEQKLAIDAYDTSTFLQQIWDVLIPYPQLLAKVILNGYNDWGKNVHHLFRSRDPDHQDHLKTLLEESQTLLDAQINHLKTTASKKTTEEFLTQFMKLAEEQGEGYYLFNILCPQVLAVVPDNPKMVKILYKILHMLPKEMFGYALQRYSLDEIRWCLHAMDVNSLLKQEDDLIPDSFTNQGDGLIVDSFANQEDLLSSDDYRRLVTLYKELSAEHREECFPNHFLVENREGKLDRFAPITEEQRQLRQRDIDFERTAKEYHNLLEESRQETDDAIIFGERRRSQKESVLWVELMSKYHFNESLTLQILSHLEEDPVAIAKIIDCVRIFESHKFDQLLSFVKKHKEEIYIPVLRDVLLFQEASTNEEPFLCNLSNVDYLAMIQAIPSFINEEVQALKELQEDSYQFQEIKIAVKTLFSRLWKLHYTDLTSTFPDYGNQIRLNAVNGVITSMMKFLVTLSPQVAAKVYSDVLEQWGVYITASFKRRIKKEDFSLQLEAAFDRLSSVEALLTEASSDQFSEFTESCCYFNQDKKSIFAFMFNQEELGVSPENILTLEDQMKEQTIQNLCTMVPPEMFEFVHNDYPTEIKAACYKKLKEIKDLEESILQEAQET